MIRLLAPVAAALVLMALPAAAEAVPSLQALPGDYADPVHVAGPAGDASRVFIVEQGGRVELVVNGQAAATPFLDLTEETLTDGGGERGLLSIAFAPDYAASGSFYVFLTARGSGWPDDPDVGDGDVLILRGVRSAQNPNLADNGSLEIVADIDHSASNHNGGQLAFGPDGALYASVGDNASSGNAQTGNFLGKILRFADPRTDTPPTVWAKGLRNPWRFSFDRTTGDVWIGDVGESTWEEIDRVAFSATGGHNFGWPECEGVCSRSGFVDPVRAFPTSGYRAVIGGVVVRHPGLPSLVGRYVFAGLQRPSAESVDLAGGSFRTESGLPTAGPRSFGEDGCGRVYLATGNGVSRLTETASTACVPSFPSRRPPGGGQPPPGGTSDTTKPAVTVKRGKRRVRAFVLKLRSDEAARATVTARGYRLRTVQLAAGVTKKVTVKARRRTIRKLRGRRRVVREVRVRVVDAAGNRTVRTPKIRLR